MSSSWTSSKACRRAKIPIRVGVNSGSVNGWFTSDLRKKLLSDKPVPATLGQSIAESALEYIKLIESFDFHDIMISLKASDVLSTIDAYRYVSKACDYPLHLGVTASGTLTDATVKSSIGIGVLLLEGIGDTIRISLTGTPHDEIRIGYKILQSLGLRKRGLEIISCPTCGRTEIDVIRITGQLRSAVDKDEEMRSKNIKVAVMGCVVNGPGEAGECDIAITGGRGFGFLFREGKMSRKILESNIVTELIKEIKAIK